MRVTGTCEGDAHQAGENRKGKKVLLGRKKIMKAEKRDMRGKIKILTSLFLWRHLPGCLLCNPAGVKKKMIKKIK